MKTILKALIILSLITLVTFPTRSYAHGEQTFGPSALNGFVGYQFGIGTNGYISRGFDANLVIAFINGGYSNKTNFGSNAYIGLGIGSILQFQYGFAYSQRKNLLRFRSDIPLSMFSYNKGIWRALAVGLYWEKRLNDSEYSNNFGISITIGISNLIFSPGEKK
jgi:hypothetical protein